MCSEVDCSTRPFEEAVGGTKVEKIEKMYPFGYKRMLNEKKRNSNTKHVGVVAVNLYIYKKSYWKGVSAKQTHNSNKIR